MYTFATDSVWDAHRVIDLHQLPVHHVHLPEDPRARASWPRRVLTRLRFRQMRSDRP